MRYTASNFGGSAGQACAEWRFLSCNSALLQFGHRQQPQYRRVSPTDGSMRVQCSHAWQAAMRDTNTSSEHGGLASTLINVAANDPACRIIAIMPSPKPPEHGVPNRVRDTLRTFGCGAFGCDRSTAMIRRARSRRVTICVIMLRQYAALITIGHQRTVIKRWLHDGATGRRRVWKRIDLPEHRKAA